MGDIVKRQVGGKVAYYVRWYENGKRKQRASHQPTREGAKRVLAQIEANLIQGKVGIVEPTPEEQARQTITVRELADKFLDDRDGYSSPKIKCMKNYRHDARKNLARLPTAFSQRAAATIRLADVERLRDGLLNADRDGGALAGASVVQVLGTLSTLFNWARRGSLIDCANPVSGVERPRAAISLDYLAHEEVAQLFAKADDLATCSPSMKYAAKVLAPMVRVAVFAGLRKGELYGLRWRDVHLDAARLDVARSYTLLPKSGKARHIPMHPELVRYLREWKKECPPTPDALVFPLEAKGGKLRMGAKEDGEELAPLLLAARCHLPADGHWWHMLRHTFASHFIMAGGNLLALQRLLGHSTPIMTQRYAHLAPDYLLGEVARLNFALPAPAEMADLGDARRKKMLAHGTAMGHERQHAG